MKSSDKIIIKNLSDRFKSLSSKKGIKIDFELKGESIEDARKSFKEYVQYLADLPPPSDGKDDVGFSSATNSPMRKWLENENEGLNSYTNLYRAIQIMKIHKGQFPEGVLDRISKIVRPYAETESKKFGTDITSKKIRVGKKKYKGKTIKSLSPKDRAELMISLDPTIMEWVEDIELLPSSIKIRSRQTLSIAFTNAGKATGLISSRKDGTGYFHEIRWEDITPESLERIKSYVAYKGLPYEKRFPKRFYPLMDKLWAILEPISRKSEKKSREGASKDIDKLALERKKYKDLPIEQQIIKLLDVHPINYSVNDIVVQGDDVYIDVPKWSYKLNIETPKFDGYPKARRLKNKWYTLIRIDAFKEIIKNISNETLANILKGVYEIVLPFIEIEKKEYKEKSKHLEDKNLQEEGKRQILSLKRYYTKLPTYDEKIYAGIVSIAKAIEDSDIKDIIGISLVPFGSDIEWEKKNYRESILSFSNKGNAPKDQKVIVVEVPKSQVSKLILKIKGKSSLVDLQLFDGFSTSKTLMGKNVKLRAWIIDNKTIIPNQWHKVGRTSLLMNDWAGKLENKFPLMSFAIRKWIDTNEDVLGKDCDPKLSSLWGKGYYRDIEDKEMVEEIKKSIPRDFETEGLIPSKSLGGKPQKVMFKPYEYQEIGAYFAYKMRRAYIGDTMGLGKTIQALLWLRLLDKDNSAYPALVCAPASVVYNWIDECKRWLPKVSVSAYDDKEKTDIRVISWGSLANQESRIINQDYESFIVDEAHYGKNGYKKPSPQRAKAFMRIGIAVPNLLLLSGTPMENRVDELWSQIFAINPHAYPTHREFELAYSPKKEIKLKNGMIIKVQDDDALKSYKESKGESLFVKLNQEMRCLMIRRLKSDVQETLQLPEKKRIYIQADVGAEGKQIYKQKQEQMRTLVGLALRKRILGNIKKDILGGMTLEDAVNKAQDYVRNEIDIDVIENTGIALFGYLRRATADAKIPVATQWIKDFISIKKKPLLIWADHQKVVDNMKQALNDIGISYGVIDGSVSKKARNEVVKDFQRGDTDAVILTKAGREGLTLTRASDALFVERWLVPTWEEQAEDRIYRIGQKDEVNIYYLMMDDSTDVQISEMIDKKRKSIQEAVGLERIEDSIGKEASIEDSVIKHVASQLIKKIKEELEGKPLREDELIPSDDEIRALFMGEEFEQEFLQVFPKINISIKEVVKVKSPSRGKKLDVYDLIRSGDSLADAKQEHGSTVNSLLSGGNIITRDLILENEPINKVKMNESLKDVVTRARNNNWMIPLATAKKLASSQQIKRFVEKGLGKTIKRLMKF